MGWSSEKETAKNGNILHNQHLASNLIQKGVPPTKGTTATGLPYKRPLGTELVPTTVSGATGQNKHQFYSQNKHRFYHDDDETGHCDDLVELLSEGLATDCATSHFDLNTELDFIEEDMDDADDQQDADNIDQVTDLLFGSNESDESNDDIQDDDMQTPRATPIHHSIRHNIPIITIHGIPTAIPTIPVQPVAPPAPALFAWLHNCIEPAVPITPAVASHTITPSMMAPTTAASTTTTTSRKQRNEAKCSWTAEEDCCLREGIQVFQNHRHKWSRIKQQFPQQLRSRSNVDLKDRWRNLQGRKQNRKRRKKTHRQVLKKA